MFFSQNEYVHSNYVTNLGRLIRVHLETQAFRKYAFFFYHSVVCIEGVNDLNKYSGKDDQCGARGLDMISVLLLLDGDTRCCHGCERERDVKAGTFIKSKTFLKCNPKTRSDGQRSCKNKHGYHKLDRSKLVRQAGN